MLYVCSSCDTWHTVHKFGELPLKWITCIIDTQYHTLIVFPEKPISLAITLLLLKMFFFSPSVSQNKKNALISKYSLKKYFQCLRRFYYNASYTRIPKTGYAPLLLQIETGQNFDAKRRKHACARPWTSIPTRSPDNAPNIISFGQKGTIMRTIHRAWSKCHGNPQIWPISLSENSTKIRRINKLWP